MNNSCDICTFPILSILSVTVCDSRDGYFDTAPLSKIPSQPSRTVTHSLYCLSRALVSVPHGHAHSERESHALHTTFLQEHSAFL